MVTILLFINSSTAVLAAQGLIDEVESGLNCTATNLQQVGVTIPRVEQLISQTEENLQEV